MASKDFDPALRQTADFRLSGVAALALQKVAAGRLAVANTGLGADVFPFFQTLVGGRVYAGPDQTMARLAEARVAPDMVLGSLIPRMAALIGEQWLADNMSWSSVTIVSARLQALAWRYIEPMMADVSARSDAPKVLMIAPEGETHTLGCVLAIGALVGEGVAATGLFGETDENVFSHVSDEDFGAIGVSTSGCIGKERLLDLIEGLQIHAPDSDLAIGGSISTCNPQLLEELRGRLRNLKSESLTTLLQSGLAQGRTTAKAGSLGSVSGFTGA